MPDVIVIGGGISGLTAAWKLLQQGLEVLVLESKDVAGGNIRTIDHEGFRLELGPYSFLGGSEYMWRLIEELEFEDSTERSSAAADNRFIYRGGRLVPLPFGLGSFLSTPLLSSGGKFRLASEPFIRNGAKPEDTAWDFFVRRFGTEAATYIMGPFVSGIYAGDPRLLGAQAAFPRFHDFERQSGSMILGAMKYMIAKRRRMRREGIVSRKGLYSFKGGLGAITRELSNRLVSRLITGVDVRAVEKSGAGYEVRNASGSWTADAVICATPPHIAGAILNSLVPGIDRPLTATPMSPVSLIHWGQPAEVKAIPDGFGFLMPRIFDLRVLGTIFASQLFPSRVPDGQQLLTSYYGGMLDGSAMSLDDKNLTALLLDEHSRIFGTNLQQPGMVKIIRYPNAIPQLTVSHPERMNQVRSALEAAPGVYLAGNYLTGVGVEHAVHSGFDAAHEAIGFLEGSRAVNTEVSA